ncbi:MAG: manganese-binding transcriptional regulator MntR [Fimbriimonadaceae bacterium]
MNRFSRTRQDHRQETAEDYVELIAFLIHEKGEARVVDMAEKLGVSQVTVSKTVKRLAREGLVKSEPYRSVFLTERGDRLAREAEERHRIVLRFLRRLGISEATAQADVEGIEHHVSPETLEAMKAFAEADDR